jgi:MIP family channel proteins
MAKQMSSKQLMSGAIMELFGVFALVYTGGLNGMTGGGGLISAALAHALVLAVMIGVGGRVSGGHFNPAVSVTLIITGDVQAMQGGVWIACQFVGGILGGLVLWLFEVRHVDDDLPKNYGIPKLNKGMKDKKGKSQFLGFFAEFIATFFLVFAVVAACRLKKSATVTGAWVAMTVFFGILTAGPMTGGCLNPARYLGPAMFEKQLFKNRAWIYYVGPIVGGIVGGLAAQFGSHAAVQA